MGMETSLKGQGALERGPFASNQMKERGSNDCENW